jgi:hypothetical protein
MIMDSNTVESGDLILFNSSGRANHDFQEHKGYIYKFINKELIKEIGWINHDNKYIYANAAKDNDITAYPFSYYMQVDNRFIYPNNYFHIIKNGSEQNPHLTDLVNKSDYSKQIELSKELEELLLLKHLEQIKFKLFTKVYLKFDQSVGVTAKLISRVKSVTKRVLKLAGYGLINPEITILKDFRIKVTHTVKVIKAPKPPELKFNRLAMLKL